MLSMLEVPGYVIFGFTMLNVLYVFLFSLAGALRPRKSKPFEKGSRPAVAKKMLVLLPAYREDAVIIESAKNALEQDYPADRFDVAVIADSLQPETVTRLRKMPIQVVEVSFAVSTKVKSLMAVLNQYTEGDYDVAVILDADNHMAPDFLSRINQSFVNGWRVVQGHRVAKNTNTSVAVLDAVSEEINNHLLRKGHRALGLSSGLIGSGMAFEYRLIKELLMQSSAIGGFDKELELRILKQRIRIDYLEEAFLYDEKVQNGAVFEQQRTRWIAAQLRYLKLSFFSGIAGFFKGNFDYADKVFQTLLVPRVLLLGILAVGSVLALVLGVFPLALFIAVQLALLLTSLYLATPQYLKKKIGFSELVKLPGLIIRFVRAIVNHKQAGRRFLHTPHNTAAVESNVNS